MGSLNTMAMPMLKLTVWELPSRRRSQNLMSTLF
jgi:hypothetical protein